METDREFIAKLEEALKSSTDAVEVAEHIVEIKAPSLAKTTTNVQVLANFLADFKFEWDNFDGNTDEYNENSFASATLSKIEQILADINSGNNYSELFIAELAYSKLSDNNYDYKIVKQNMAATTLDEAIAEKDILRSKAPKVHSDNESYTLEDVRVLVKVLDQNGAVVLDEKFIAN